MTTFSLAFTLFLIMNSLGTIPVVISLLKNYDEPTQKKIIFREMWIALGITLFFYFLGEVFFAWLNVSETSIQMAGGLILFLIAIRMVFPGPKRIVTEAHDHRGPFIVPIATPLIAGPSLLATVMFYAHEVPDSLQMFWAILLAWIVSTAILLSSSFLKRIIGDKGLNACERLMGLILTLVAVQMFLQGLNHFLIQSFHRV